MPRPLVLFYLLVLYVLFQFSWWAYLLMDLNQEVYQYRIELLHHVHDDDQVAKFEEQKYNLALEKKWAMILGEGAVFLSLLLFGIYRTRKSLTHEFRLARQQKNFLLSVTHEFKSPLAAVKLNLQTLLRRDLDRSKHEQLLRRALTETDRINLLVENALLAARFENHSYELYIEKIDFSRFTEEVYTDYQSRQDGNHELKREIEPEIFIKGDRLALHSIINNLLENAEKYSPEETTVTIRLKKSGNDAVLMVADEGTGIPVNERTRIFQKFYRLGNEDTRRTKGTGLGLYIVSTLVQLHQGRVQIKSNEPRGSIFEVSIPLTEKP
jgi:two-component system phosphate regulon sensor histidine kinase PhoR